MKIGVLSGSPKNEYSVTLQSVLYLQKHNTEDDFFITHVGHREKRFENSSVLSELIEKLIVCDLILFCYPVYTFLAPSQLHRFIELLKRHPRARKLSGKFVSQITTSKHFYDNTAHKFIEENCFDLGMKIIPGLAADMDDLLTMQGRKQLCDFGKSVKFNISNNIYNEPSVRKGDTVIVNFKTSIEPKPKTKGKRSVIVSDCSPSDNTLRSMIEAFKSALPNPTDEFNLAEFSFSGGCLGCFKCAASGNCIYKDGFEDLLRNDILSADAIIYAGKIKDHSMGWLMKRFHDRQFCNGHRVLTNGKAVGYILDGKLSTERNMKDVMEARSDVGDMVFCGAAVSESADNNIIDDEINKLAKSVAFVLDEGITTPQSYLGVGGMKVFRDLIFTMQGFMKADHKHYKKHGAYDFPYKKMGLILKMKLIGFLMRSKFAGKQVSSRINNEILKPYKKAIGELETK